MQAGTAFTVHTCSITRCCFRRKLGDELFASWLPKTPALPAPTAALLLAEAEKTDSRIFDKSSALPYFWVEPPIVNNKGTDNA